MPARPAIATSRPSDQSFQIVVLSGVLRGAVVTGVTSTGDPVCSFDLQVVDESGRSLVPLTWRNPEPPAVADGDALVVRGRVVKRFHRAGAATVARTSVEVDELLEVPKPAAVRRLVARAVEAYGDVTGPTRRGRSS